MRKRTNFFTALCLLAGLGIVRAEVANPPTEFLPAPEHDASTVTALFSSTYEAQTTVKDIHEPSMAQKGEVKNVSGRDLIFIDNALNAWCTINFKTPVDISAHDSINLDIYVVSGAFNPKIQFAESTQEFVADPKLEEGWNRLRIGLNDFRNSMNPPALNSVSQIRIINKNGYPRTLYIDNVYAFGEAQSAAADPELPAKMAPVPTVEASKVKSVFSDAYQTYAEITKQDGTGTMKIIRVSPAEQIMKIEGGLNHWSNLNFNAADFSDRAMLHVDIYVVRESGETTLKFKLDNTSGGTFVIRKLQPGWNYLDLPLSEFAATTLTAVTQFCMINNSGSAINIFLDNLYAYGDEETGVNPGDPTAPTTAAPTPLHEPENVISLFSDVYETPISLKQTNPGDPTSEMEIIDRAEGDQLLRFTGLNWTLVSIDPATDFSNMDWIHVDVYAIGTPKLNIGLGDTDGKEGVAATQYLQAGWNSIDLPLSVFQQASGSKPGADLGKLSLLRLWSASGFAISKLYFDNIYAFAGDPMGDNVVTYEVAGAPEPIMPHTTSSKLPEYVVKSVYSDKYTAVTTVTAEVSGDETKVTFPLIQQEDRAVKIVSLTEASLKTASSIDLSDMEYIHFNFYRKGETGNVTVGFKSEGMENGVFVTTQPDLKTDDWCFVNIPMQELVAGGVDCTKISEILFKGNGNLYVDNIYATTGEYFLGLGEEGKISIDWTEASQAGELPDRDKAIIGVNLASACGGTVHGSVGTNYFYPTRKDLYYFKSQGMRLFRFPFRWERVQHELNGELDLKQDVDSMKKIIAEAERLGMYVMPDMHNYCRYTIKDAKHTFGTSDVLTKEAYADVWRKLAAEFNDFTNIYGYDIMNEPYGLEKGVWKEYAQAAIDAIREVDMKNAIVIEGESYASASKWPSLSDDLKTLNDPADNLIFQAHCYFDATSEGLYKKGTFDLEVAKATQHIDRLRPFVEWLKENGLKGIVGEFGVPRDDARWLMMLDEACEYLTENGVWGTYWVGGEGYANDHVSVQPLGDFTEERAQMRILRPYFAGAKEETGLDNVQDNVLQELFTYPNPVGSTLSIHTKDVIQAIRIFSVTGKEVKSLVMDSSHADVDLSDLTEGVYFVQACMANGKVSIGKIIKH